MTMFSDTRAAFLDAAGPCTSIAHPLATSVGQTIATDLWWIGPRDADAVLVLISGTHGIEGYAGSMIQTALLEAGAIAPPPGVATLIIHAINPVGMATCRRVTEDGVDLNRNFVAFPHEERNTGFDSRLADLLAPHPDELAETGAQLIEWMVQQGAPARITIASGQYSFAQAPFFGGAGPTWSRQTLEIIARDYLQNASHISVIDYHTGLGAFGTGQLIGAASSTPDEQSAATQIWGSTFVPVGGANSVAFDFGGDLIGGVKALCPNAFMIMAAQEFGTRDEMTVLQALRHDHGATRFGVPRDHAIEAMLDAFYPDDEAWRTGLIKQASVAVSQAYQWLSSPR